MFSMYLFAEIFVIRLSYIALYILRLSKANVLILHNGETECYF